MKFTLYRVRAAFVDSEKTSIFTPKKDDKGNDKYGCSFLLDPATQADQLQALWNACQQVAHEKWPSRDVSQIPICLRDGNTKGDTPGYAGMWFVNASSDVPPSIVDRNPNVKLSKADGRPYGGCYVNALIEIWAQDNSFGKKVNAQLRGVQFVEDGEAFAGSAPASTEEFEQLDTAPPASWGAAAPPAAPFGQPVAPSPAPFTQPAAPMAAPPFAPPYTGTPTPAAAPFTGSVPAYTPPAQPFNPAGPAAGTPFHP